MDLNTLCGQCQDEERGGDRESDEVNVGEVGECDYCQTPVCEQHGKEFHSKTFNAVAHYDCHEV